MEGQDRQGASELQRHHHDRDLPVGARPRLAVISRSSRSRTSCRCSRRPTRRRSSRSASAPCRPTATSTTCSSFEEAGQPVEPVYATEGTPLVVGPNGIFKNAPNPNAARLFQSYCFSAGMPAARHRRRRPALGASADQGEARPQAAQGDQDHEGGRRRRRKERRRDQGCVTPSCSRFEDHPMRKQTFSRRDILKGSTALAIGTVFAEPVRAAAPPAEAITPALIEAAKKEGKCAFYTAMDLQFAEKLGKDFEAKYPRHHRAGRALRRRARVHPHRPGVFEQHPRGRRGQHRRPVALHRLEAQRLARAVPARGGGQALRQGLLRPRRLRGGDPRAGLADRLSTPIW